MADPLRDRLQAALGAAYTIERELGGGGMSRVFAARDEALGRDVVVKVLAHELARGLSAERFAREIRLAAALQEPHIVPVLTAGTTADGLPYYTMPFVRGQSLRARISAGAVPVSEAIGILRDVARALAYAHARGVVHRDIKPENVLLHEGTAVVADFGIAKALAASKTEAPDTGESLTQVGTSLGTPAYMAPEQAAADPATDQRADLYAWGVMAYELLAGRHPFAARVTPQQLLAAHMAEVPRPLPLLAPGAPVALCEIVMRCLAKDPAERPASATTLVETLDRVARTPEGAQASPRVWRRPDVTRRLALGASVLIVLVAGAMMIFGRRGASTTIDAAAARNSATGTSDRSGAIATLAVLPFVNTGGDQKDDYFSDGMTDELAHALARLPGIRLAGRSSSFAFKGRSVRAEEIGRTLDVAGIVEGTVRRAGDRLRVTAQLTSTADGKVRWSDSYESRASDVFEVQDELTRAIVVALRPALGAAPTAGLAESTRGTANAAAYDLYLRGRHFWQLRGGANLWRAVTYFRRALALDPTFARAEAGLAMTYAVLPGYVPDPADTLTSLALASARRAVALDSSLADAHLAHAHALDNNNDWRAAERGHITALALEPENVTAHHWYGNHLLGQGRPDEAVAALRRAAALDPLSGVVYGNLAMALLGAGRFDEALAAIHRMMEVAPERADPTAAGPVYLYAGLPDSALAVVARMRRIDPDMPGTGAALALAHAALGQWAQVDSIRAAFSRPGADLSGGVDAAVAALAAGDRVPLLRLLSTPAGRRYWRHVFQTLGCTPILTPLMGDQGYIAMLDGLGVRRCPVTAPWPIRSRR